ncbi:Aminopeptidase N [Pseudolycoriella hygida]|uniref:Aminopeptidase n=1 Tax=Pseudolycoriella hygida TaxID=35572 RepID=A0A9Q0MVS5_9DIPT|nr:Aminopeptidase N [Pseudolycoriella hygida]
MLKPIYWIAICLLHPILANSANYRLPTSLKPEHYKLQVVTHLGDNDGFKFSGKVWIKITCEQDSKNVTLHSKNLEINTKQLELNEITEDGSKLVSVESTEFDTEHEFFIIYTTDILKKGRQYELYIPFEAELNQGLLGYYRSSYVDQKTQQRLWISVTQFESTFARRAFPCFDEPEMKAKFEIILGHEKKYNALSNMPVKTTSDMKDKPDWVWSHFEESVPMSTYLVAYTINDFEYKESVVKMTDDVLFRIWARRDALDQVEYAKYIGPKVLKFYEDYFDIKFPLPKMDMIAIPDFSAVVTMQWWEDLWLNEGFATYVASLGVEYLHPEWNSFDEESVSNTLDIFKFDSLKSSHPVSVPIGNPAEIAQIFDKISYEKGSSIIRMMHLFLGEDAFRWGVSNYLKRHKYGNAAQDNLWECLTDEAHKQGSLEKSITVKEIMDSWTVQTGYPIVSVERNYEKGTAKVSQKRYLSDTVQARADTEHCWWVPLSYTSAEELDFNNTQPESWLKCKSSEKNVAVPETLEDLPKETEWVIFNIEMSGLYKVKYDEKNWDLLIAQLAGPDYNKISSINRAQLIDDALDLAWTGEQDYSIALRIVEYLKHEKEYIPWKSALDNLSSVNRILRRSSQYGLFKKYMQSVLEPIYNSIGGLTVSKKENDRLDAVKHKVLVASWSCRFAVGDCEEKSKELFSKWMEAEDPNKMNPVPLDLRSVVYCTAVRLGGEKEWNFLWNRYAASNVGTEKVMILSSLGCSREIWLLQRYLDWSLDESSGVRKQDSGIVFGSIATGDIGFHLAKSFLIDRIDDIYAFLQPDTSRLARYIKPLAIQMITTKEYDELKTFVENRTVIFEKATQSISQSLETVEINSQWQAKNYASIGRILNDFSKQ